MFDILIKYIKNHFSLIIIIFGALCFFLSNILLKEVLSDKDYGIYSVLTTYLSVVYIYGLLGFEQVFLRYSFQKKTNLITTQKYNIILIICLILVATVASFFVFHLFYNYLNINLYLLFCATLAIIITLFIFSIFRLNTNYVLAQISSNSWKITLLLIVFLLIFKRENDVGNLINTLLIFIVVFTLFLIIYFIKKIRFEYHNELTLKHILNAFFNFFISITCFSLIVFGDRFIIEHKIGIEEFGNYFYLSSLVLAPFSIFQNYIGFKQLINFKNNFDVQFFKKFNYRNIIYGIILSMFIVFFIVLANVIDVLNFNFTSYKLTITLLLILGIVRVYDAGITAAFEARTNVTYLKYSNVIVITTALLIISLFFYLPVKINEIVIGFIFLWIIKSFVNRQFILRQNIEIINKSSSYD